MAHTGNNSFGSATATANRAPATLSDITLLREKINYNNPILWYYAGRLSLKAPYAELALEFS
jgi:hypothetical protein